MHQPRFSSFSLFQSENNYRCRRKRRCPQFKPRLTPSVRSTQQMNKFGLFVSYPTPPPVINRYESIPQEESGATRLLVGCGTSGEEGKKMSRRSCQRHARCTTNLTRRYLRSGNLDSRSIDVGDTEDTNRNVPITKEIAAHCRSTAID